MSTDTLQWLALAFMFFWLLMISMWIGETTTLLKSWWNDWLKGMIKDRGKPPTGYGYEPGVRYIPRPLTSEPQKRNGDD